MFISSLSFACWFHSIIFLFLFVYREKFFVLLIYIYIIQVREREESQIVKERDERWVNSVRVCLYLGIEMFWIWLALAQAFGVVSEIYPNYYFFFSLKKKFIIFVSLYSTFLLNITSHVRI